MDEVTSLHAANVALTDQVTQLLEAHAGAGIAGEGAGYGGNSGVGFGVGGGAKSGS